MSVYNWLTLFGIPGLIAGLFSFITLQIKQNNAIKLGLQAILRDRLLQAYEFYAEVSAQSVVVSISAGSVSSDTLGTAS